MSEDIDLAALLCSRICHDLISPVGAVGNGLELLAPPRGDEAEVRALIGDSAATALAALGFFRVAFGMVGDSANDIGAGELQGLTQAYLASGRHSSEWEQGGDALPRGAAKLLLLMVLTGMTATPIGGRLSVAPPRADPLSLRIVAAGRRAGLSPEATRLVTDATAPTPQAPREAHLAILARQAERLGARITIDVAEERVTLSASG